MQKKLKNISGFTLIEMAMVMVIVGIVISIMMTVLPTIMKTGKIKEAQGKLAKYDYALQGYALANSRLPFAATNQNTGIENPGTLFGYLPYTTLGLSGGKDVWGQTVFYAVHSSLTASGIGHAAFCTNLNAAVSAPYNAAIVHTTNDAGTSVNKAYVIISGGPKDLDSVNSYLDLLNGTAAPGNLGFNYDDKIQTVNYDDLVRSLALTVLSSTVDCPPAP